MIPNYPKDVFKTGNSSTDKRVLSLHPEIRMQAMDFVNEANGNPKFTKIVITQRMRTIEQQDALYAQNRTPASMLYLRFDKVAYKVGNGLCCRFILRAVS